MELALLLRGMAIGFAIAAPVGPISILCIRRTIAYGRIAGLVSGLGAATADAFYASLAALGLSFITTFLVNQQIWLQWIGGIFLCFLGVKTYSDKPQKVQEAAKTGIRSQLQTREPGTLRLSDYSSTLFLTLTNPLTILSFTAIFAGIGLNLGSNSTFSGLILVAGVFLGSASWWVVISSLASLLSMRLVSHQSLLWINRLSGAVIFIFGVVALSASIIAIFR